QPAWLIQDLEDTTSTSLAQQPRVVFDLVAVATAVWEQSRPYIAVPFASRGAGGPFHWSMPESIVGLGAIGGPLDLAADAAGNIMVVFSVGSPASGTFSTWRGANTGWNESATLIDGPSMDGYSSYAPRVAMVGGMATAVWARGPAGFLKATANRGSGQIWLG